MLTGFNWLRIGTHGGFGNAMMNSNFHKAEKFSSGYHFSTA